MPRARWWAVGALALVTVTVVGLDAGGVIFESEPAEPPPPPLVLPQPADASAALPAPAALGGYLDRRVVADVRELLTDDALGASVHAQVVPLDQAPGTARSPLTIDADEPAAPASTLKLWTAIAVLDALAAEDRLVTSVVWDAASGRLVLVGGGDTTLTTEQVRGTSAPSLEALAGSAERALRRLDVDEVRLGYDDSLFTGPSVSPDWEDTYVSSGVIAPVSALMSDQGRVSPDSDARHTDPARAAADSFAELLEDAGVDVQGAVRATVASDAEPLADVESLPIIELVEQMLRDSDNQLAESLGRIAASQGGQPASFDGAAEALLGAAEQRGVDVEGAVVHDASGLARDDRMPVQATVDALLVAAAEPALAPVLSGLAVAGFDGTLADRFVVGDAGDAAGLVRAKTGTLTGISAEAGVATTCEGSRIAYTFVADEVVDTFAARAALDDAAAELTSCPGRG